MPKYTDQQLEEALRKCKGMVYVAAKTLGCSGNTIKSRLEKSEKLREVVIEESEIILDTAEIKLAASIMEGDLGAIKYILSTKGKSRGYVERIETNQSNFDFNNTDLSLLNDYEIERIIAGDDPRSVFAAASKRITREKAKTE